MTTTSLRGGAPQPASAMFGDVAMPPLGNYPCVNRCGNTVSLPGVCQACVDLRARQDRGAELARARASVPDFWAWARFGAPEMATRLLGARKLPAGSASVVAAVLAKIAPNLRALLEEYRLLVLWGDSGVGKTSIATALLQEAIDAGAPLDAPDRLVQRARLARFLGAGEIEGLGKLDREVGDKPDVEDAWFFKKGVRFLVLDNLGVELDGCPPGSPLAAMRIEASRSLLTERITKRRETVITLWNNPEETARIYGTGLARMLFEAGPWAIELKRVTPPGARR